MLEWYIYGSFHIALCTAFYTAFYFQAIGKPIDIPYVLLIFFGTHIVYSLHKILAKERIPNFEETRFKVILGHQKHILIYVVISMVFSMVIVLQMPWHEITAMILPGSISMLYVLPIFPQKKRLRDYPFIKILLIALCFALLCTANPLLFSRFSYTSAFLSTLSSFLFILGITLPFDIRDMQLDAMDKVNTFATTAGERNSRYLSALMIFLSLIIFVNVQEIIYPAKLAFTATSLIGIVLGYMSSTKRSDYYFSFFMDGLLALPFLLFWVF